MEASLAALRGAGLCPRALWVSGLRDLAVQRGVADLLQREGVQTVLCSTSFASVQFEEAGLGAPLWEQLGVPVLQLLCSSQPRSQWHASSIGLGPTDLTLQVALPELDGRITTRIGAFKETVGASERLASALQRYQPDAERLAWIAQLAANWIRLRQTPASERRIALVLANYPTRNSRLANGVGLDTPASTALMLQWLVEAGYGLEQSLPCNGEELIQQLLDVPRSFTDAAVISTKDGVVDRMADAPGASTAVSLLAPPSSTVSRRASPERQTMNSISGSRSNVSTRSRPSPLSLPVPRPLSSMTSPAPFRACTEARARKLS
jgi:cobalamin biosynthesis Mg chelatase CobN